MSDTPDIIGRGFTFPFRVDKTGSIALTTGADDIESAMRVILCTAPGERVMRPEFGCKIWDLLFEPVDANTLGLMAEYVRLALSQWEPRAVVDDVTVTPRVSTEGVVDIAIVYTVQATNDRRNLVYPFYVIPEETES